MRTEAATLSQEYDIAVSFASEWRARRAHGDRRKVSGVRVYATGT